MTQTAVILRDSITPDGQVRGTSWQLRYPRFIHAEFMTHRVFSRNASSSRAIPTKRLIADVRRDPAMPVHWGKNQAGMQAREELTGWRKFAVRNLWLGGMWIMTSIAWCADKVGVHKQVVNRLIEPWSHITVCVTATDWANFFELRDHPDADPTIADLARKMRNLYDLSMPPRRLGYGEWHLAYTTYKEILEALTVSVDEHGVVRETPPARIWELAIKVDVARCARTSYKLHDGTASTIWKDVDLYDRLVGSRPLHASPAEHQFTPDRRKLGVSSGYQNEHQSGNFAPGVIQYRKTIEGTVLASRAA